MILRNTRVLITGVRGFIGGRLAERLSVEEGARVIGLARKSTEMLQSPTRELVGPTGQPLPRAEIYEGDITQLDAVERAVAGCDVVIHCAAMQYRGSLRDFRRVNVDATLGLIRAARETGVKKLIHLSTINVLGYPPPRNANADSPLIFTGDAYSVSKAEGERAARLFADKSGFRLVVIRPACTYGPRSRAWTLNPLARVARRAPVLVGKGDGICNAIYIDNLVDLIILSMKNDSADGRVFIGAEGRGVEWREFYGAYALMLNVQLRSIPRMLALGVATVSELAAKAGHRAPFLSRSSVEFFSHRVVYDIASAREVLGFEPKISFKEGMASTRAWLAANRYMGVKISDK